MKDDDLRNLDQARTRESFKGSDLEDEDGDE